MEEDTSIEMLGMIVGKGVGERLELRTRSLRCTSEFDAHFRRQEHRGVKEAVGQNTYWFTCHV